MANTLTTLTNTIITDKVLEGFTNALTAIRVFATDLSSAVLGQRGDSVKVLYVPSTSTAADFAGTYSKQDSTAVGKSVSIDKHKFVDYNLTDKELVDKPQLSLESFGYQKGQDLALAVWLDIMSAITNANYGAAAHTGLAANFDSDDVIDLGQACTAAKWRKFGRNLILDDAFYGNLLKDTAIKNASAYGGSEGIRKGMIPSLGSFDGIYEAPALPANGENLGGFAVLPDALLVAMRYLAPQSGHAYSAARPLTDPDTGMTLGVREWYDNDTGTSRVVIEANYGYAVGNAEGIKRIVTA